MALALSLVAMLPVNTVSAADAGVCHLPTYGGDYYCAYQSHYYPLSAQTEQVFVIGTDFSVWTRWKTNGKLSNWVSLGGKIRHSYNSSDFQLHSCGDNPWVLIYGLDNAPGSGTASTTVSGPPGHMGGRSPASIRTSRQR